MKFAGWLLGALGVAAAGVSGAAAATPRVRSTRIVTTDSNPNGRINHAVNRNYAGKGAVWRVWRAGGAGG
jgi:hypothetical protein